eukprot:COSAG06_NODE_1450_length_9437_cov_5.045299_15_plen_254_part_00
MESQEHGSCVASSWDAFEHRWGGLYNCLMDGELVCELPDYTLPPLEDIVNTVRADGRAVLRSGVKSNDFDLTDISDEFRSMPISAAMQSRFILAHFHLNERFGGPGQIFEGLEDRWVEPWRRALAAHGFTFSRVFSILFAAGPHSSTNYHMDYTQQLAWQRYGTKHWGGLLQPDRWTTMEQRTDVRLEGMGKPPGISESDVYTITQHPNTVTNPVNISEPVQRLMHVAAIFLCRRSTAVDNAILQWDRYCGTQ